MIRSLLLAVGLIGLAVAPLAQPASARLGTAPSDLLALPGFDNAALDARYDAARRSTDGAAPLRFAEPTTVSVEAARRPGWETTSDGTRVWRLVVASPGAYSLSFGFSHFALPEGAKLWIYPEGGAPEYRPFTADDNEVHGQLWTPIVPGDRAVIELELPVAKPGADAFDLELSTVNHAFRPTLLSQAEKNALSVQQRSGACNVDVVCPEGDGYRDIIQSVGAYTVRGTDFCSGAAVNNTAEDGRPLFLTANHCGVSPSNQAAVVVYWNYQSTTCRATGSAASGGLGNGARREFNTGSVELADNASSDWSILELDDPILDEARVYYAGWDRRDIAPTSAIAIHHPGVEDKRISFENDATTITTYSSPIATPAGTHIRVSDWDLGTTEGGSSGSPLFNADKQIVGQLHGGGAACGNNASDWYGRMHRSMNDGLAAILDPSGSGVETLDGRGVAFTQSMTADFRLDPGQTTTATFYIVNPTAVDHPGSTVTARVPAGFTYAGNASSTVSTASASGDVITWTGTVAAGSEMAISFDLTADGTTGYGLYDVQATTSLGSGDTFNSKVAILVITPRDAPTASYEATPSIAIPDNRCPSGVSSTITVAEDWTVGRVSAGVNLTHTYRSDLDIRLTSPAGTSVVLLRGQGGSAGNVDVLFDDAGTSNAISGGTQNVAAPYYADEVLPGGGVLASFLGESAQGDWTLAVCDGANLDTGALNRWALYLVEDNEGGVTAAEDDLDGGTLGLALVGPNPVGDATRARLTVDRPQRVRAVLLDATGRQVRAVFDGDVADTADLAVDVAGLSAGAYFLRVDSADGARTLALAVVR